MTTTSTTATLTPTTIDVTREDSFIPTTRMQVSASTSRHAKRSKPKCPLFGPDSASGTRQPAVSSSERT